jgi:hypothetical protein
MNRFQRRRGIATGIALLLVQSGTVNAGLVLSPSVEFAPGYEAALQAKYGDREAPALRSEILDSVSAGLKAAHGRCNLNLDIVLERAAPTHPTMKQQLDDPSMDPFRSVFLNGGAALTGQVRGADGRVLATVKHQRFADNRSSISPGKDPWSDARVAIWQFTSKLVDACKQQTIAAAAAH